MELYCPLGISRLVPQDQRSFFGVLSHIINPLLTKLVRSGWLDIGLVLFLRVYGPRRKHAKKELGQYPAILTSRLVNNPYVFEITTQYGQYGTELIPRDNGNENVTPKYNLTVTQVFRDYSVLFTLYNMANYPVTGDGCERF